MSEVNVNLILENWSAVCTMMVARSDCCFNMHLHMKRWEYEVIINWKAERCDTWNSSDIVLFDGNLENSLNIQVRKFKYRSECVHGMHNRCHICKYKLEKTVEVKNTFWLFTEINWLAVQLQLHFCTIRVLIFLEWHDDLQLLYFFFFLGVAFCLLGNKASRGKRKCPHFFLSC